MQNRSLILKLGLMAALFCSAMANAEEPENNSSEENIKIEAPGTTNCDGNDPNSGLVLIPEEWVKRCKLCSAGGELEFDYDCLKRLAYDFKYQPDQYNQQFEAVLKMYIENDLKYSLMRLTETGQNTTKAKQDAGYGKILQEAAKQVMSESGLTNIVAPQDKDGNFINRAENGLSKDKDGIIIPSNVEKCVDDQGEDSGRCAMEANNRITTQTANILNKLLASAAMIEREDVIDSLVGYVLPNTDVNKNNKALILPSDKDAEDVNKSNKEKTNE